MDKKRTGIAVCMAALVILAAMLVFQGIQQFPQSGTGGTSTTGAAFDLSVTSNAVDVQIADGPVASSATSGPEEIKRQAQDQKKERSGVIEKKNRTPAPEGQDRSSRKKEAETGRPSESRKPSKPNGPSEPDKMSEPDKTDSKKAVPSERVTKVYATPASASTPDTSTNNGTSIPDKPTGKRVRMTIQCTAILDHRELWKDGIEEIIPDNGIFYAGDCDFEEGDTVYDILKKICGEEDIALDSQYTPVYGTYYIRGIGHLYEFDCGSESGWKYSVNGKVPGEGCSSYGLSNGDNIIFYYDYKL